MIVAAIAAILIGMTFAWAAYGMTRRRDIIQCLLTAFAWVWLGATWLS